MACKCEELEILPVKSNAEYDEKKFKNLHKNLLKPPYVLVMCGSVRTGKSTLLMNLLFHDSFYKNKFDKIFFYSPTVMNDLTLRHLAENDDIIKITGDDLDKIDDIFKEIVNEKMEDEETAKEQYLHIFDDCLGIIKPKSFITTFATKYRHSRNSMIFTTQLFRLLPPVLRTNATGYVIWGTNNHKELMKMNDEFSGSYKGFLEMYEEATSKPYNFLYLDMRNGKAYHNFQKLLYEPK